MSCEPAPGAAGDWVDGVLFALRSYCPPMESSASFLAEPPLTGEVTAVYDDDLDADGYVSNATRAWGWRPDLLTSFQDPRNGVVASSDLSPREVAVMVAATAAARGDSYCSLAWGTKLADLSDAVTAAQVIQGEHANLSSREAALARWSRQVVNDPNATTQADIGGLRSVGFSDREILEATVWIAFRLAFSTINDAVGAPPDVQLFENAPGLVRQAVVYGRKPIG
jgi:uncharacterized peroxidase-related enzyme